MAPDFITKILQAGSSVELTGMYAPEFITTWIQIAVARGGHVTLSGMYAPEFVINWAKTGGSHFTYRDT
jgi:hypothetical protein